MRTRIGVRRQRVPLQRLSTTDVWRCIVNSSYHSSVEYSQLRYMLKSHMFLVCCHCDCAYLLLADVTDSTFAPSVELYHTTHPL